MMTINFPVLAYILSWFHFNKFFIDVFSEMVHKDLKDAHYYIFFLCAGLLFDLLTVVKRCDRNVIDKGW